MLKFGRSLTLYSQAPPRFAKQPKRRVPHSQPTRYRERCNADRSGFCPYSAFGSKLARSMPLCPHTKERLRHRCSDEPRRSCCEDQNCAPPPHILYRVKAVMSGEPYVGVSPPWPIADDLFREQF